MSFWEKIFSKKDASPHVLSFDDPSDKDQMRMMGSLYAGRIINKEQFRDLLIGKKVTVDPKGYWEDRIVEPGYLVEDESGEHVLLQSNANKKLRKKYAEDRALYIVSVPPALVPDEDGDMLARYDRIMEYRKLFEQICDNNTSKSERKVLVEEAEEIFYSAYKSFKKDKKKPENQQPKWRSDEPELKKFAENGYRTLVGMLEVSVDDVLAMKPKQRARFLDDLDAAADNFATRSSYLRKKVSEKTAKGIGETETLNALIWYFKGKSNSDMVSELEELRDTNVSRKTIVTISGLGDDEVAKVCEDYRLYLESKNKKGKDGKNKRGKGSNNSGNQQDNSSNNQNIPPTGGSGSDPEPDSPYKGKTVDGCVMGMLVKKRLTAINGIEKKLVDGIMAKVRSDVGELKAGINCSVEKLHAVLLAYETVDDLPKGTAENITNELANPSSK